MKNFNKLSMVLFDSTNAAFKLSIEGVFTKTNNMGGFSPLVYVTNAGAGNLNPNIYLLFTYKSETFDKGNMLYMSYPQLFRVREAMESIKDLVATGKGFMEIEENSVKKLIVKQEYVQPVVLANIGKNNKWLSFKLIVMSSTVEGVTVEEPGVSIEISSQPDHLSSALSIEEFLTVYTIVKDLDLASIQCQMSLAYLMTDGVAPAMPVGQPQYQPQYQPFQQPAYQPRTGYQGQQPVQPRYNAQQPNYSNRPAPAGRKPYVAPQPQGQQPVQPQTSGLKPREESTPVMTLGAVEETPVSEVDYSDEAAINEIFGE